LNIDGFVKTPSVSPIGGIFDLHLKLFTVPSQMMTFYEFINIDYLRNRLR